MNEHTINTMSAVTATSCLVGVTVLFIRALKVHILNLAPPAHLVLRWFLMICAAIAIIACWSSLHGKADPWLMVAGILASLVTGCSLFMR